MIIFLVLAILAIVLLIYLIIYVGIPILIGLISAGLLYGGYKAILSYITALKRTYGKNPNYYPRKGMKALVIISLIFLAMLLAFVGFLSRLTNLIPI